MDCVGLAHKGLPLVIIGANEAGSKASRPRRFCDRSKVDHHRINVSRVQSSGVPWGKENAKSEVSRLDGRDEIPHSGSVPQREKS